MLTLIFEHNNYFNKNGIHIYIFDHDIILTKLFEQKNVKLFLNVFETVEALNINAARNPLTQKVKQKWKTDILSIPKLRTYVTDRQTDILLTEIKVITDLFVIVIREIYVHVYTRMLVQKCFADRRITDKNYISRYKRSIIDQLRLGIIRNKEDLEFYLLKIDWVNL